MRSDVTSTASLLKTKAKDIVFGKKLPRYCVLLFIPGRLGNIMFAWAYVMGLRELGISAWVQKPYQDKNDQVLANHLESKKQFMEAFPNVPQLELPHILNEIVRRKNKSAGTLGEAFNTPCTPHENNNVTVYSKGYFMEERFFAHCKERIREAYQFDETHPDLRAAIEELENDKNSVAVHVRRGDYLAESTQGIYTDICTSSYYHAAMEYLRTTCGEAGETPNFYFFSDDMPWVEQEFSEAKNPLLKRLKNSPDYCDWWDMCLMSHAHHNIIANSSFSWWAAWLNAHEDKIVICPELWNNIESIDSGPNSIRAQGWIIVGADGLVWGKTSEKPNVR